MKGWIKPLLFLGTVVCQGFQGNITEKQDGNDVDDGHESHQDISQIPGTGAAGAMGAGMIAFFGSRLQMGIQTVLDTVKFDEMIADADYIFTGEGKLDSQSLRGKVVIGIAERAKKQNKKVIAVVGGADDSEIARAYEMGVTSVFPINRLPQDFSVSRHHSQENLAYTTDNILRLIAAK